MHDFATHFDKLRPTIRKHNNKTEEQCKKRQALRTKNLSIRLSYFETPYFQASWSRQNIKKL